MTSRRQGGHRDQACRRNPLHAGSLILRCEQLVRIEAGVIAGVAGRAHLIDLEQHGVAVAVQPHGVHVLGVARCLALDPMLLPRARVVGGLAGLKRAGQCDVVHPRDHQHLPGAAFLRHRGEQPVGVALQPRRDTCVERRHRTTIPSLAIAALTWPMVSSPKWNTLAASTASAPATTAGAKCSTAPAPPLAINGTETAPRTARSILRSKPALVPS